MIAAAILIAAVNFGATPEEAAMNVPFPNGRAHVVATARGGRYAVVEVRGAAIEASVDRTPILLEHFSFGWQPLFVIDAPCQFGPGNGITPGIARELNRHFAPNDAAWTCPTGGRDRGPSRDVEAIRKLAHRGLIPFAVVAGDFGFLSWTGGQQFFERVHGRWKTILTGPGAFSAEDAAIVGIPRSASLAFGLPESFGAARR
jgi:hypothetical protein